ncbi:MAG: MlaC/ttg2D family ABC transporter substrate-binding protein [Burkholderiaceae bacterium]
MMFLTSIRLRVASYALTLAALVALAPGLASAQQRVASPDDLIKVVTQDILDTVRADRSLQQGDLNRMNALVDQRVMPVVDFSKMTALTVGIHWRRASPAQQEQLMAAFRELLLLTYADALRQVQDTTVQVRPARYAPEDQDVVVRTFVLRTGKEPIQLDYRLHKTPAGWKIYDFNVLGLWLVDHYRSQFSQLVGARGIDGLIAALQSKNKSLRQSSVARGS